MEISLTNVPKLVLTNILDHADFKSILTLRVTCHAFHDFINQIKPSSNVRKIRIRIRKQSISFVFYAETRFLWKYNKKWDPGFLSRFLGDLEFILSFQRTTIQLLDIICQYKRRNEIFEKLGEVLKNRQRPLPVKSLRMEIFDRQDVIQVVPLLKSGELQNIELVNAGDRENAIDLNGIAELDQWKLAMEMDNQSYFIRDYYF